MQVRPATDLYQTCISITLSSHLLETTYLPTYVPTYLCTYRRRLHSDAPLGYSHMIVMTVLACLLVS